MTRCQAIWVLVAAAVFVMASIKVGLIMTERSECVKRQGAPIMDAAFNVLCFHKSVLI